jgi:hypothetical protein
MPQTIDITPTWREILPALLSLLENPVTRQNTLDELTRIMGQARMAHLADRQVATIKAEA